MKVALVHDCLREYGDTERVLSVLHRIYPDAPIYTAFYDRTHPDAARFAGWDIRTTWAQRLPGMVRHPERYRVLLPYFWESLNLSNYDLVISSASQYLSHVVLTRAETLHVCYCHTPARSLWEPATYGRSRNLVSAMVDSHLRQHDFNAAQRVDHFITNSQTTAKRIRKFYRRPVEVIPPPVKVHGDGEAGKQYYLYVGELHERQQVDQAIAACNLLNRPLWIVGRGADRDRLRQMAGPSIRFLEEVPEDEMAGIYAHARALIFPRPDADFGFSPVEAMGYGVPVIAFERSGIREVVLNYRTGLLYSEPTIDSLCDAIRQFEGLRFFPHACIQRAEEFAESVFVSRMEWFIAQVWDQHQANPTPVLIE